jgi:hypothetical protein
MITNSFITGIVESINVQSDGANFETRVYSDYIIFRKKFSEGEVKELHVYFKEDPEIPTSQIYISNLECGKIRHIIIGDNRIKIFESHCLFCEFDNARFESLISVIRRILREYLYL